MYALSIFSFKLSFEILTLPSVSRKLSILLGFVTIYVFKAYFQASFQKFFG